MNIRFLLTTFLLSLSFSLSAELICYRHTLNREFLINGEAGLIHKAKNVSEESYANALEDIIDLANRNDINAEQAINQICNHLTYKIQYIQRTQNQSTDWKKVARVAGFITASAAILYSIYYGYQHYYKPNNDEYYQIAQKYKSVKPDLFRKKLVITPYPGQDYSFEDGQRLLTLYNKSEPMQIIASFLLFLSFIPAIGAVDAIKEGLYFDHSDDKNLEKYKQLLEITQKVRRKYFEHA